MKGSPLKVSHNYIRMKPSTDLTRYLMMTILTVDLKDESQRVGDDFQNSLEAKKAHECQNENVILSNGREETDIKSKRYP